MKLFLARGISSGGVILLTLVAPITTSIDASANLFTGITLLYLLAMISRMGCDMSLMRAGARQFHEEAKTILPKEVAGMVLPLVVSLVICGVGLVVLSDIGFLGNYYWVFVALPVFSGVGMLSSFMRGSGHEILATAVDPGAVSLASAIILLVALSVEKEVDPSHIYTASTWVIFVLGVFLLIMNYKVGRVTNKMGLGTKRRPDNHLFLMNQISSFALQWYPVFLFSTVENKLVVYYAIANRIATVISFVKITVDNYASPRFAAHWSSRDWEQLVCEKTRTDRISLILAPAAVVLTTLIALLYGVLQGYDLIYYAFSLTLIIAYGFGLATGPNSYFLMMTDENPYATRLSFVTAVLAITAATIAMQQDQCATIPIIVASAYILREALSKRRASIAIFEKIKK